MTSKTDFNGRTTTYTYESMNRLLTKTADPYFAQNQIGASSVSFGYTASGKRSLMSDASGFTSYRYDSSFDRLSQIFNPEGSASYSYDLGGNLTGIFGPGGAHYYYDPLNRLGTVQWQVGNNQIFTNYGYDAAGNLQTVTYPNGVAHNYSYNVKNQLTNLAVNNNSGAIASYAYTLDAAGHRTQVTELGGRTVQYGYDSLYRLTSETISGASSQNGAIGYVYDSVGNRTSMTSTVPAIPAGTFFYDANDRRGTDVYDADGNTTSSGGLNYVYDFENHLVQQGGATFVYDGDGNRVQKTVAGAVTHYFVDSVNPTGFAQVLAEETASNFAFTNYTWGLDLISRVDFSSGVPIYFVHDGHGSVRALTNPSGAITDTYDYDAFGNLIHSSFTGTAPTPNNYLFAGEQFDPDLALYYNRARYLNVSTGRFWSMDSAEGDSQSPISLHKYLFAGSDPINLRDPSGHDGIGDLMTAAAVSVTLTTLSNVLITGIYMGATMSPDTTVDALTISAHGTFSGVGWTAEGGVDLLYQLSTRQWFAALTGGLGTNPLGAFATGRGLGGSVSFGVVMNSSSPQDMSGLAVTAVWPLSVLHLFQSALFNSNKSWGLLTQLAKNVTNVDLMNHASVGFGVSSSGSPFASLALRSNAFGSFFYDSTTFYPVSASGLQNFLGDARQKFGQLMSVAESITSAAGLAQSGDQILAALNVIQ